MIRGLRTIALANGDIIDTFITVEKEALLNSDIKKEYPHFIFYDVGSWFYELFDSKASLCGPGSFDTSTD